MSRKQLTAAGAQGSTDLGKYDPASFITVADAGHLLHKPSRLYRYDIDNPKMVELIESIDEAGVISPVTFRLRDGQKEVVFGNRRLIAARVVNERRKAEGRDPILVAAHLRALSDAALTDLYTIENKDRDDSDPMTDIETMYDMEQQGVAIDRIAKRFHLDEKDVKKRIDPTGVLAAHRSVQAALAQEIIDFGQARRLARLPPEEQAQKGKALLRGDKPATVLRGEKAPRRNLTAAHRATLRALLDTLLAGQTQTVPISTLEEIRDVLKGGETA